MIIKALITTLDNLPILKCQISILRDDPLISEIIVVNNGSIDNTKEWLNTQDDLITINHEKNNGASIGRNSGLDIAREYDYILLLDGGILPLIDSTKYMLDYLRRHPEVDVISPEVATCFTTDENLAHRRMVEPIRDSSCFPQRAISSTAYALCRYRAFDGIRYCTIGPFGIAAWAVEDNELQFQWNDKGILHHDFQNILVYRHQSGSFGRLFKETGVWPNQYGSGYEQRNVLCAQMWPQYYDPIWHVTNLQISVCICAWNEYPIFAKAIKRIHKDLENIPHEIIFVDNGSNGKQTKRWLDTFALRWEHGDTAIDSLTGEIMKRNERKELSPIWSGNVIRIDLETNMGQGYGLNRAFEKARGKYICVMDGDILPVRQSLSGLYSCLENHPEKDFIAVNANVCQGEEEDPEPFPDFENRPVCGMGNYAYGYSMFRRKLLDVGIRYPETGPFEGPGCSYIDADFACQMYEKGIHGWLFNFPGYYHKRRDLKRTGSSDRNLEERRKFLAVKWPGINYDITFYHDGSPERHIRRVAVVGQALDFPGDFGYNVAEGLGKICRVNKFLPDTEPEGYDDYLYVDPANWQSDCFIKHPSVLWISDMVYPWQWPNIELERHLEIAQKHDRVFTAQPSAAIWLREQGINAMWLPQAANPDLHKPYDVPKDLDWIALWHNCGERIKLIEAISKEIPNGWVSYQDKENYAKVMSRALCSINLPRVGETNMRIFEVMSIGVPLITLRGSEGLDKLFVEGKHYLGFSDFDECIEKITWVKNNPERAQEIADGARNLVLSRHTYYHRALSIFGQY